MNKLPVDADDEEDEDEDKKRPIKRRTVAAYKSSFVDSLPVEESDPPSSSSSGSAGGRASMFKDACEGMWKSMDRTRCAKMGIDAETLRMDQIVEPWFRCNAHNHEHDYPLQVHTIHTEPGAGCPYHAEYGPPEHRIVARVLIDERVAFYRNKVLPAGKQYAANPRSCAFFVLPHGGAAAAGDNTVVMSAAAIATNLTHECFSMTSAARSATYRLYLALRLHVLLLSPIMALQPDIVKQAWHRFEKDATQATKDNQIVVHAVISPASPNICMRMESAQSMCVKAESIKETHEKVDYWTHCMWFTTPDNTLLSLARYHADPLDTTIVGGFIPLPLHHVTPLSATETRTMSRGWRGRGGWIRKRV